MCRSIKLLRQAEGQTEDEEIRAAALQFVRFYNGRGKAEQWIKEANITTFM